MDSNTFKETCRIIDENYENACDNIKGMRYFSNIISEFNKIIATNGIIKTDVYDEIVLFVKIHERVSNILNFMTSYTDLKKNVKEKLEEFPTEITTIREQLERLMNYESTITRELHEIDVLIANSGILEDTKTK